MTRIDSMRLPEQDVSQARDLLASATRLLCICHRNPDGDAIGSLLGIGLLLEQQFPAATVSFHCVDPVPTMFHFLPGAFRVSPVPDLPTDLSPEVRLGRTKGEVPAGVKVGPVPDPENTVVVFVDCGEPKLTEMHESHPQLFDGTYRSVMFDHHYSNPRFGTANLLVPEASSTCEIITWFAQQLGWPLTADIATSLLTGVYTDTGGLLHSNVTPEVYRAVAHLVRAGARRQEVVTGVFRTGKLSTLRLWGRVLEKISLTEEGGAISAVTEGDFRATGADYSELTGAIDYVNAVPGMRFSLILSEREGKVKGSLRTLREDVDVSKMAQKFQGGGHKKAAGFALPGKLKPEVRWKVVEEG